MTRKLELKELDLDMINPMPSNFMKIKGSSSSKIVAIGKPGTGKSWLIASILYNKRKMIPVGSVFSGTEDSNAHYSNIFPKVFVYDKLDSEKVSESIKRQKIAKKYTSNPWSVLLLDDCMDDPKIFNQPLYQGLYKNGRHWNYLFIVSLQYAMDVKPVIRTAIDGTFILRETNLRNRRCIWENYAGVIPDFDLFCEIMDQITDDHTALYIHNSGTSNKLEDCVFWYKAKKVPEDFKFGCPEFWKFAKDREDPEYKDSF